LLAASEILPVTDVLMACYSVLMLRFAVEQIESLARLSQISVAKKGCPDIRLTLGDRWQQILIS